MAELGETVAVIDQTGQVVSTSKKLFGIFKHARGAYRERKAQIKNERNAKPDRDALKAMEQYTIDDGPSTTSKKKHRSSKSHHSKRSHKHNRRGSEYEQDLHSAKSRHEFPPPPPTVRRHTYHNISVEQPRDPTALKRSKSDDKIDMALAYGDFHPSILARDDEQELNGLVTRTQRLLEEAHCVRHSATATIAHLQKNPDTMAAVALTLAEISNLVGRMAPATLTAFKTGAPAVWALLASPEFMIAAGVGLGVTVVAFGSYKIVKRIQASNKEKNGQLANPIEAPETDQQCLSHVETWRRGVADAEARSVGTSIDGEYISPMAAAIAGAGMTAARVSQKTPFNARLVGSQASPRRSGRSRTHKSRKHSSKEAKTDTKTEPVDDEPAKHAIARKPVGTPSRSNSKAESRHSNEQDKNENGAIIRKPVGGQLSKTDSKTSSKHSDKKSRQEDRKKTPSRLRLTHKG